MSTTVERQIRTMTRVVRTLRAADVPAWLFGGWGLDARTGRVTRQHGDLEFWVERIHAEQSKGVLTDAGADALDTQPPEESCEFTWSGVEFSTAYFDRRPDGAFSQPDGRWSDWVFPPSSFVDAPIEFEGVQLLVMSVEGMLAMKEQYPTLRNGGPWRPKDVADITALRGLLGVRR